MPVLEHTGHGSLGIDRGEVVSVLGPPGSGKSLLALELAFLGKPADGEVRLHGKNPLSRKRLLEAQERPREVALLVQNAEDQLFARTVFDDVAFGPRHLDLSDDEIERRVLGSLRIMGLDAGDVRDRSPFDLSGGERRRVAVAGVIAMEPEVLVLDEPTANLDSATRNDFLNLLQPLRAESAIIWLTARAQEAALADRVYLLTNGALSLLEAGKDLLSGHWQELARAGIELPTAYELVRELQTRGWDLPDQEIDGRPQEAIVSAWKRDHHDR